jgi:lambda family phage portal protein
MGALDLALRAPAKRLRAFIRENPRARSLATRAIHELSNVIATRHYEAASKGRRTEGWLASSGSANSLIGTSLFTLRNRSRQLGRDNPHAHHYFYTMTNNIVGTGPLPSANTGDADEDTRINGIWKRHSTRINADGTRIGAEALMWLGCYGCVESGESLLLRRPAYSSDGLEVPVQVELLEADLLDHSRNESKQDGTRIINGVELDPRRRVAAYHILKNHPGDYGSIYAGSPLDSARVSADDIAHLYLPTRPGQRRGVPWITAGMTGLRDLDDYRDAERVRKKIEASLTAFVMGGPEPVATGDETKDRIANSFKDASGNVIEMFEPGLISYLPGDKRVEFNRPQGVGGYPEYIVTELHSIAAALLIPYVLLAGDLRQVNYSSIRAGMLEFYRLIKVFRSLFFIPLFCDPMWDWTMEAAYLVGKTGQPHIPCDWATQKFESIDPLKEAQADMMTLKAGTRSLAEIIAEKGRDPDDVIAEMAQINEKLAAKNLKYEWQLAKASATDTNQPSQDDSDKQDKDKEE